jgi:predicted RNase H-like HicB family nuclease
MISHYPVVLEHEANGTVSAYVVGLPGVFAAADTEAAAARAIRSALRAHLAAPPDSGECRTTAPRQFARRAVGEPGRNRTFNQQTKSPDRKRHTPDQANVYGPDLVLVGSERDASDDSILHKFAHEVQETTSPEYGR